MPDQAGALLVSLQDRASSSTPTEGHRGFGALYGTDLAVVVLGPDASWSSAFDLEVLVTPADPEDDTIVERHRLRHIEVASLGTAPDSRVAAIRLATTSRYATQGPDLPPFDVLVDALSDHAGLKDALVELGLLPAALDALDPATVLGPIDGVEEIQRRRLEADRIGRTAQGIVKCLVSPRCDVHPPPP